MSTSVSPSAREYLDAGYKQLVEDASSLDDLERMPFNPSAPLGSDFKPTYKLSKVQGMCRALRAGRFRLHQAVAAAGVQ